MTSPLFARPDIASEVPADGCLLIRSREELLTPAPSVGAMFASAAAAAPERILLAQPGADGWRELTYARAHARVESVAQSLLSRGLDRPVLILSGNSADHLVLSLACQTIGVPYAPVSTAYSLRSRDFGELRAIGRLVRPGLVFAEDASAFAGALAALGASGLPPYEIVASTGTPAGATRFADLLATPPTREVRAAAAAIGPSTVAKYLFTSGSTGAPKRVITTHGMLCANQRMIGQVWPFLRETPPVLLDWLPWSHTFGGSHNTNLVIANGGTLYLDDGRPTPQEFGRTLRHLETVTPTVYLNVPRGLAMLTRSLELDPVLARRFFSRLQVVFYAAAALPQDLWTRLEELARRHADHPVALTTSWGATETAPAALSAHFPSSRADCVGVPLPGVEVKITPVHGKAEIRVRGPHVTPGYLGRPDLTAGAFDAEGYLRTGDAVRLIDPADPSAGLRFDGRLAEDFKLDSGTWVDVSAIRNALLSAAGSLLSDCVITGHDRRYVGALARAGPGLSPDPALLAAALRTAGAGAGSSRRIRRLLILSEPPRAEAGEITDKGYLNQAACLRRRAAEVAELYREPAPAHVIDVGDDPPASAHRDQHTPEAGERPAPVAD
ncbi:feruloyl-CoA synthase [Herbidospora cretacea]|uniref:feruloyl-CoA synthase n=1 Tax=Herbidospora cretacea TaxID=28444 RepID=UPI00068D24CA|nr:feruloyl-CoA synthase [Herbidospora cretacea]